jgi:dTDP-4-amino-4,6-dideoxygalactose transaminase
MFRIPFNKPDAPPEALAHVATALASAKHCGDGPFTAKCHARLESLLGAPKALLTTSCTHALEMTSLLLKLQPGDEVIIPSFTFVSTANAFALFQAKIVFADIRPDTLNLDETLLDQLITPRTRVIVPVHYAGIGCEMDAIMGVAQRHGLTVVEDNAHGIFGQYRGRPLGSFGSMSTLSFHETKNLSCGEGGALIINDSSLIERAEITREKGTNRSRFFRGQVDKYSWVDLGSSYLPSEILAAVLWSQLESAEEIQTRRRRLWEMYDDRLRDWAARRGIRTPVIPSHCQQSWHMYYLLLPTPAARDELMSRLRQRGILAVSHYLPLHLSAFAAQRWGGKAGDCPVTEDVSERLLRLPLYHSLSPAEQEEVIEAVCAFEP